MNKIISVLKDAASLNAKLTGEPVPQDYIDKLDHWGAGEFRIVVMGEIKKGKSSFINAMLGVKELVPVSSDVATSTIYKIHYGTEKGYRVYFTQKSGRQPLEIPADKVRLYGTEDGNPGNEKMVDFIEVTCPADLLKTGIVIIDTPGLGGVFREHKKITWQYVRNADAVFFVTDSVESPIGRLELEYLVTVRGITPHCYFVQTKCYEVDSEAREARRKNNLSILSSSLCVAADKVPYFLLDSNLRFEAAEYQDMEDLEDSGFPRLRSFVSAELLGKQKALLARRAISFSRPMLQGLQREIESRKKMLELDSEHKRRELQDALEEAQRELNEWLNTGKPDLEKKILDGLDAIFQNAICKCNACCPDGEMHAEFERMIDRVGSKEELSMVLQNISDQLPEFASKVSQALSSYLNAEVEQLLGEVAMAKSEELRTVFRTDGLMINKQNVDTTIDDLQNGGNGFDAIRAGMYGGMTGTALGVILGGLIGSVVPVVGPFIGSAVGTLIAAFWGGGQSLRIKEQNELRAAKQQARGDLEQAVSSVYANIMDSLKRMIDDIKKYVADAFQRFASQRGNELQRRQAELAERERMNAAEVEKSREEVQKLNASYDTIMRELKAWGGIEA